MHVGGTDSTHFSPSPRAPPCCACCVHISTPRAPRPARRSRMPAVCHECWWPAGRCVRAAFLAKRTAGQKSRHPGNPKNKRPQLKLLPCYSATLLPPITARTPSCAASVRTSKRARSTPRRTPSCGGRSARRRASQSRCAARGLPDMPSKRRPPLRAPRCAASRLPGCVTCQQWRAFPPTPPPPALQDMMRSWTLRRGYPILSVDAPPPNKGHTNSSDAAAATAQGAPRCAARRAAPAAAACRHAHSLQPRARAAIAHSMCCCHNPLRAQA